MSRVQSRTQTLSTSWIECDTCTKTLLNRFRRLKIRYEHRADIHLAFLQLGCALISLRFLG